MTKYITFKFGHDLAYYNRFHKNIALQIYITNKSLYDTQQNNITVKHNNKLDHFMELLFIVKQLKYMKEKVYYLF